MKIPVPLLDALRCDPSIDQLVVGIGSPSLSDRAGWDVTSEIARMQLPRVQTRCALVPLDVLDWIEDYAAVHLVDAMIHASQTVKKWRWPDCQELAHQCDSTHGFDVIAMLQLAETLGKIRGPVWIWGLGMRT